MMPWAAGPESRGPRGQTPETLPTRPWLSRGQDCWGEGGRETHGGVARGVSQLRPGVPDGLEGEYGAVTHPSVFSPAESAEFCPGSLTLPFAWQRPPENIRRAEWLAICSDARKWTDFSLSRSRCRRAPTRWSPCRSSGSTAGSRRSTARCAGRSRCWRPGGKCGRPGGPRAGGLVRPVATEPMQGHRGARYSVRSEEQRGALFPQLKFLTRVFSSGS